MRMRKFIMTREINYSILALPSKSRQIYSLIQTLQWSQTPNWVRTAQWKASWLKTKVLLMNLLLAVHFVQRILSCLKLFAHHIHRVHVNERILIWHSEWTESISRSMFLISNDSAIDIRSIVLMSAIKDDLRFIHTMYLRKVLFTKGLEL